MKTTNKKGISTEKLVLLALLTAMTAVLSYLGGFIKIGSFASISLTLIPVVLGAALCGPFAGAWLGAVASVVFFITPDAAWWMSLSAHGTVITVMIKGIAAGLAAGLVYKLLEKFNRYVAIMAAAVVCPIVNTGLFIAGCFIFFMDSVKSGAVGNGMSVFAFIMVFYVGLNFLFELLSNVIFSPVILRLLNIREKK